MNSPSLSVPCLQPVCPDRVVLVPGHLKDLVVKDEGAEPLFKLLHPVLDGVDGTEDEDSADLLAEVGHQAVNEGDGLQAKIILEHSLRNY